MIKTLAPKPLSLLLCAAALFTPLSECFASEPQQATTQKQAEGKIYVLYTKSNNTSSGGGVVISDIKLSDFMGTKCYEGKGVPGYMQQLTVRVPIDNVALIIEYDSKAQWLKSVESYNTRNH